MGKKKEQTNEDIVRNTYQINKYNTVLTRASAPFYERQWNSL